MNATTTTNNTLSSLSLFSLKTLFSIEGTQNNREDVSARDDVCALNCALRDEVCLALKMKTRATRKWKFCCEETRERNWEKREKFCFFSFVCLFVFGAK